MSIQSTNKENYLARAVANGSKYVLDVCDGFDYTHYPVFVMEGEILQEVVDRHSQNMQSVYGIYEVVEQKAADVKLEADKNRDSIIEILYNIADVRVQAKLALGVYDLEISKGVPYREACDTAVIAVRRMCDQ